VNSRLPYKWSQKHPKATDLKLVSHITLSMLLLPLVVDTLSMATSQIANDLDKTLLIVIVFFIGFRVLRG